MVSLTFSFILDEANSTVLNAIKAMDRGSRQTRKEIIADIEV